MLGSVCVCVPAPLVPRLSWLGCAVWVCVLWLRFRLRPTTTGFFALNGAFCGWPGLPTTTGWGVEVCVLVCSLCLYSALLGCGLWSVGWVLPGTSSCAVVPCGWCALPGFAAPGGRCCLAPVGVRWLWPGGCLSGVPRGPASVRRASFGPVALSAPLSFQDAVVLFLTSGGLRSGFTGRLRTARGGLPKRGSLCLPLAAAKTVALGSLCVLPVRGPAMGLSLEGPSGVGLGLRALRWVACVDPVTDASGFLGLECKRDICYLLAPSCTVCNAPEVEPDLPGLQPLLPLSHGHALIGPPLVLAPLGITTLLIFGRESCPPSSWRVRQLRGLQSGWAKGQCKLSDVSINRLTKHLCNYCIPV